MSIDAKLHAKPKIPALNAIAYRNSVRQISATLTQAWRQLAARRYAKHASVR